MSDEKPRAKTAEEARDEFLRSVAAMAVYWAGLPDKTPSQRCNGVAFSILSLIDGTSDLPALDLTLTPHDEDEEYHRENGDNWYEAGQLINGLMLHEQWRLYEQSLDPAKQ